MRHYGRSREHWFWLYTGFFGCVAATLTLIALWYHKTLIWVPDGYKQHYTIWLYMGQALRSLAAGEGWPMMHFSLGQGMDLLTTCAYYGYTDPFILLSAFAQGGGVEWMYLFADFLRAWLAGVTFALYARKVGAKDGWAVACAAAIYVSSGYFLWMLGRHPYFLNGALYLPLLLLGVERILNGRKWLMFTLVAALTLVVNFYFAYINTLIAVFYIIVRLIARIRERGVSESAKDGFLLVGSYLLGAALSAVVFLPVLLAFAANSRLGIRAGYDGSLLHYGEAFYKALAVGAFTPWRTPGDFLGMNYMPLALIGLLAALAAWDRRSIQARIGLLLCIAGVCVPLVGLVFNGGGYVTNRWSYALNLFVALSCAFGLPKVFGERRPRQTVVALLSLAASAALIAATFLWNERKLQLIGPALIICCAALLLVYRTGRLEWLTKVKLRRAASILLAVSMVAYAAAGYLPAGYGYISEQADQGAYTRAASESGAQLIKDEGFYRAAQAGYDDAHSIAAGYMGTSFFWSLVDSLLSDYYRQLYLPTQSASYLINNLGGNVWMNAVASVKYFLRHDGQDPVVPYGFERASELELPDGTHAEVYENANALPLGYAYDARVSQAEYDALPVEDKFQALAEYAICDAEAVPIGALASRASELEFTVSETDGVEIRDHWLGARAGGSMTLSFEAPADCETYLVFDGITVDAETVHSTSKGAVTVSSACGEANGIVSNRRNNFFFPQAGHAYCLGSRAMGRCTVTFASEQNYTFDAMRVVSVPLDGYRAAMAARQAEAMTDVVLSKDRLTGRITVGGDRVLQIAVPYSAGWTAWVDGEEQPVFRCGGMYMGIAIGEGTHDIDMRYVTPGLVPGAAISAAALLATIVLAIATAVRRRRHGTVQDQ